MKRTMAGLVAAIAFTACAGDLENPERFASNTACDNPTEFVRNACGIDGCHSAGNLLGVVDLATPGFADRLVDQDALMCEDVLLINSANPSASFMLDKLNAMPTCGAQMPFLRQPLNARDRACVEAFVMEMVGNTNPADASAMDAANTQ